jgi:hypothetical protein
MGAGLIDGPLDVWIQSPGRTPGGRSGGGGTHSGFASHLNIGSGPGGFGTE